MENTNGIGNMNDAGDSQAKVARWRYNGMGHCPSSNDFVASTFVAHLEKHSFCDNVTYIEVPMIPEHLIGHAIHSTHFMEEKIDFYERCSSLP